MKTNLKLVLLVIGMSLAMFLGIAGFYAYRFERSYKIEFLEEKTSFGAQVANVALTGLQTYNYFEITRLASGLFKPASMLYLAVLDEKGQQVHLSTERDVAELEGLRAKLGHAAVQDILSPGGRNVAVIRSEVRDEAGKLWGIVEVAYYWDAAYRLFRSHLSGVLLFLAVFIPLWTLVLLYNTRAILRPLDQFVAELRKMETEWPVPLEEFNARLVPGKAGAEVNILLNIMRSSLVKLIAAQEAHEREVKFSALGKQAAQVAHDIRSPLAAMDSLTRDLASLPEEKRLILRSAAGRIRDIANDLLERNRQVPAGRASAAPAAAQSELASHLLSTLIDPVVTEKRMQFRSKLNIEIDARMDRGSYGLFAKVQPSEFKRALSNILNNAVEALESKGTVTVLLSAEGQEVLVTVKDDGKGIPPEVLARLGACGETHGKKDGSGLGIYHARTMAEAWGGRLELRSEAGKGTEVTLRLPSAGTPDWFLPVLEVPYASRVAVLDDDSSIHQIWQGRFESLRAGQNKVTLRHFSTPDEFREWVRADPAAQQAVFLLDYELLGFAETGLDLAEELGIGPRATLVTSRFEEKHVFEHCRRMNIRLIPKGLAGLIPITIGAPPAQEAPPARSILVDDDPLVRMTWKAAARTAGIDLRIFQSPEEFLAAGITDTEIPIYIDSEFGGGRKGEELAKQLRDSGFTRLFLETGHPAADFSSLPWLNILGKEPPWNDSGAKTI